MLNKLAILIFVCISVGFSIYTFSIYLKPIDAKSILLSNEASAGRLVWQKYNCQSCHQLYGLGGYLGTDLTNLCSEPKKNEDFVKSILKSGIRQMPSFSLSDKEIKSLYAFLKDVNKTGVADPRMFHSAGFGMIEANER